MRDIKIIAYNGKKKDMKEVKSINFENGEVWVESKKLKKKHPDLDMNESWPRGDCDVYMILRL